MSAKCLSDRDIFETILDRFCPHAFVFRLLSSKTAVLCRMTNAKGV